MDELQGGVSHIPHELKFLYWILHCRSTEGLRHLATQSLRNLNATRLMNRDEVAQELQEHDILLHSSPGTAVAASTTSLSGTGNLKVGGHAGASLPQRSASPPTATSSMNKAGGGARGVAAAVWDVDYGSEDDVDHGVSK